MINDFTMTIDGRAVQSDKVMDVINPATGQVFAQAPDCSTEQLDEAVAAAKAAFKSWKATPIEERQAMVRQAGELLIEHAQDLSRLFTRERMAKYRQSGARAKRRLLAFLTPKPEVLLPAQFPT